MFHSRRCVIPYQVPKVFSALDTFLSVSYSSANFIRLAISVRPISRAAHSASRRVPRGLPRPRGGRDRPVAQAALRDPVPRPQSAQRAGYFSLRVIFFGERHPVLELGPADVQRGAKRVEAAVRPYQVPKVRNALRTLPSSKSALRVAHFFLGRVLLCELHPVLYFTTFNIQRGAKRVETRPARVPRPPGCPGRAA